MEKRKAWYVRCSATTLIVTDGPFIETKEFVGGFTLIRANSKEEAIEWTRRHRTAAHSTLKKRRVTHRRPCPTLGTRGSGEAQGCPGRAMGQGQCQVTSLRFLIRFVALTVTSVALYEAITWEGPGGAEIVHRLVQQLMPTVWGSLTVRWFQ